MPEINLFRADDDTPIFTLNRKLTLVSISFDIKKQDGQRLEFRTISFWKLHYECRDGKDKYEIFGHRGRKYSIYKNTVQVAWWDKEGVTWFEGDNYKITADSDADAELLSCFCLIIDNCFSNNDGDAFSFDLGNIGPQARKFDDRWEPKSPTA